MPVPPVPDPGLAALRAAVRAIERGARGGAPAAVLPFGLAALDDRLAGGGLPVAALHEAAAASPAPGDAAATTAFLAGLAARLSRTRGAGGVGQVLWAFVRPAPFPPGLAGVGLGPARVFYAECRDDAEALAVMEEGLRHGGLAAVAGEAGRMDMAAARRLQLAAEDSGTTALLLRRWRRDAADPLAAPSSAVTRWRIGAVPSAPLPCPGLGRACWRVALARQRGGPGAQWLVEAPDAEARFALAAGLRDRADPADGAAAIAA
jgi:protein ImuA